MYFHGIGHSDPLILEILFFFFRQAKFQLRAAGSPKVVSESQKDVLEPRIVHSSLLGRWTTIKTMCLSSVDRQQVMLRWGFLNLVAW